MRNSVKYGIGAALALTISVTASLAGTVKIAFIDPLSGPFAATGTSGLAEFKYAADQFVNSQGGVLGDNIEIVPFDNKISAKESLIQLQIAIDQGIRFIAQGNSSGVANAITDAVKKHNKRNPGDLVLFLNYSAVDPALTNDKCNFWHFRFDANADIKMDALTDVIKENHNLKKTYLIGQDYSFGKAVAAAAVRDIGAKIPDMTIVGNELHPIAKVKDFTPYARKIMASGADDIITGNWGSDMVGLGKAVIDAGFTGPIYTYYAAATGITKTFGAAGKNHIRLVSEGALNPAASPAVDTYVDGFKAINPNKDITQPRIANVIRMLSAAMKKAGSTSDVVAIAKAMEGMQMDNFYGGKLLMRAADHQMIQDVYIMVHTDENIRHNLDNSPYGLLTESVIHMAGLDSPTTCKMTRP